MKVVKLYEDSQFKEKDPEDLGYDLYAVVLESDEYFVDKKGRKCLVIGPGEIAKVSAGVSIKFPFEYGGFIKERSGKALEGYEIKGGVIDEGYTGEYFVILKNGGKSIIKVYTGDKIAQLVLIKNHHKEVQFVDSLSKTKRSDRGFGSSDKESPQKQ